MDTIGPLAFSAIIGGGVGWYSYTHVTELEKTNTQIIAKLQATDKTMLARDNKQSDLNEQFSIQLEQLINRMTEMEEELHLYRMHMTEEQKSAVEASRHMLRNKSYHGQHGQYQQHSGYSSTQHRNPWEQPQLTHSSYQQTQLPIRYPSSTLHHSGMSQVEVHDANKPTHVDTTEKKKKYGNMLGNPTG